MNTIVDGRNTNETIESKSGAALEKKKYNLYILFSCDRELKAAQEAFFFLHEMLKIIPLQAAMLFSSFLLLVRVYLPASCVPGLNRISYDTSSCSLYYILQLSNFTHTV